MVVSSWFFKVCRCGMPIAYHSILTTCGGKTILAFRRIVLFLPVIQVCAFLVQQPVRLASRGHPRWPRRSQTTAGLCRSCWRFMCHCLAGFHLGSVGVVHMPCNA